MKRASLRSVAANLSDKKPATTAQQVYERWMKRTLIRERLDRLNIFEQYLEAMKIPDAAREIHAEATRMQEAAHTRPIIEGLAQRAGNRRVKRGRRSVRRQNRRLGSG